MHGRTTARVLWVLAGLIVAGALVMAGRLTAPDHHAGSAAQQLDAYFDGLLAGQADGRRQGRALQEAAALPADARQPVRDAFNAGYAAGANDAFAGYDGGWTLDAPYVVTLDEGSGQIVYRITARTPVKAGINYYLCPNGRGLCQQPRH